MGNSKETNQCRQYNIDILTKFIKDEIKLNSLKYEEKEESLLVYTTSANEKILIQFPGKESERKKNDQKYPYDFRPKIIDADGSMLPDMAFEDMWYIVDVINEFYKNVMTILPLIFFRMGRMVDHELDTRKLKKYLNNGEKEEIELCMWYLNMDKECMHYLNEKIEKIKIFEKYNISFEAFIYFFEMILQNEDSKYFYKKHNLTSGRINTGDSMLLLSAYYNGLISIPTLLQRYVKGKGIGTITKDEICNVTDNKVMFYDKKEIIFDFLNEHEIEYKRNSYKSIQRQTIRMVIKDDMNKNGFVTSKKLDKTTAYKLFEENGWNIIDLEKYNYDELIELLKKTYEN